MSGFAASAAQRKKVRGQECVYCGREGVDPAHLIPRSLGGCDEPACVLPFCRSCHDRMDRRQQPWLDVLSLVQSRFPDEYRHAVEHVGGRADLILSNAPKQLPARRGA